jgi:hypothetical protein
MTPLIAAAAVTVSLLAATVSDSHMDPAPPRMPRISEVLPDVEAERKHAEIMRKLDVLEKKL